MAGCALVDGFHIRGPLPSVPETQAVEIGGDPGWPAPCGPVAIEAEAGVYVARATVEVGGRVALHLAAQGAARLFWDDQLVGVLPEAGALGTHEDAFAAGDRPGVHQVRVELRPPAFTRVHFALRLTPLPGTGPVAVPLGPALVLPSATPWVPVAGRTWTPPPPRPPTALMVTQPPPMPGVDREMLNEVVEVHPQAGWRRHAFALRINTPAGREATRSLRLPHGPGERLQVSARRQGAADAPLTIARRTEEGDALRLDLPELAVGDVVEVEVVAEGQPEVPQGVFGPTLPAWQWRLEVVTDRGTPLHLLSHGASGPEVVDRVPGERRRIWQATAAMPGATGVRLGPGANEADWRDGMLAALDAHMRPHAGDVGGDPATIIQEIRALDAPPLERALRLVRRLRVAGLPATLAWLRPAGQPTPPGPPVAADFEVWVAAGDRLIDPTAERLPSGVVWPGRWGAPSVAVAPLTPPAAPTDGLCAHPHQVWCSPLATRDLGGLTTDFGRYRRVAAAPGCPGVLHSLDLEPAEPLAVARFCRAVAARSGVQP